MGQKDTLTFLKALFINPRTTGALLPSSTFLAEAMVAHVDQLGDNLVVELGAGTGVITEALLKAGIPPKQIIVIEYSSLLAKKLQARFPEVCIIEGNAENLSELLKGKINQIGTIISSLPLRTLPEKTVSAVLNQIPQLLVPNGKYIQFTYYLFPSKRFYPNHQNPLYSKIIWLNIPPAKMEVFSF